MDDKDKKKIYIELEIKCNKRFSWLLARSLMLTGVLFFCFYFLNPIFFKEYIAALFGAVIFFLCINIFIIFREKKLSNILKKIK